MRDKRLLILIWLAFLVRGVFYSVEMPVWEGFDEWAHFAYLQHMTDTHSVPSRADPVSGEVVQSLRRLPLSPAATRALGGRASPHVLELPPE